MLRRHRGSSTITLWVLATSVCSYSLLQSVSVPTLPLLQTELHATQSLASWTLTAFLLSTSVATPIMGRLGDAVGKRRMMLYSLGALGLGAFVSAIAPNMEVMIASRVLQGLGGGVVPIAFALLRDQLPPARVPGAVSLVSGMLAVGFAGGIVLAGPIAGWLGFRYVFALPAALALLGSAAVATVVPESQVRTGERVPLIPAVLFGTWLVLLLVGVGQGPHAGWSSAGVLGLFVGALLVAGWWARIEWCAPVPLIDLRLMRRRGVWTANLVAVAIGVAMYGTFALLPIIAQVPESTGYGFGATVTEAGHIMLPSAVGTFVCGVYSARLAARIGIRQVILLGCLLTAASLGTFALFHDRVLDLYIASAVTGVGTGFVYATLANAVVAAVPQSQTGVATGMNANIRTVGGTVGTAITTTMVTALVLPTGYPAEKGYTGAFAFLTAAALLAALAAVLVPGELDGRRRVPSAPPPAA